MSDEEYALFDEYYYQNIEEMTLKNNYFRRVVSTTPTMQLVLMSLNPGEEIGSEIHPYISQFIRIEKGEGVALINDLEYDLEDGFAVIVPQNTKHNIINTSAEEPLKLYTIYTPSNHPYNRVEKYKTHD